MTKNQRPILFIVILLFLRIPLLFLGSFGVISKDLSLVIYLLFTYLFTAIFIGKSTDNLEQYYITPASLIIFLVAPILGILTMPFDPTVYLRGIIPLILGGYLIKRETPPAVAIAIQGGIFWFAHIYYANTGINFWILHPVISIMLGILAYKGKA